MTSWRHCRMRYHCAFRPLKLRTSARGHPVIFLELLEPAVEFATIESDDQIHYELKVCLGSDQLPFRLFVRSFHSHMLVSSQVFAVQPGSGTIPVRRRVWPYRLRPDAWTDTCRCAFRSFYTNRGPPSWHQPGVGFPLSLIGAVSARSTSQLLQPPMHM